MEKKHWRQQQTRLEAEGTMGKLGPKGSPRLERKAPKERKINNPDLTNEEALQLTGYSKSQSALLSKRNALTQKGKLS
jgi:hypothetical protein